MAEQGTWQEYLKFDEARRKRYPSARHWIYKSWMEEFKVAEFDPLSGHWSVSGEG